MSARAWLRRAAVRLAFGADPAQIVTELRAVLRFAQHDRNEQRRELEEIRAEVAKVRAEHELLRTVLQVAGLTELQKISRALDAAGRQT